MATRQPMVAQRTLGSDVITNNGVDQVVGLMGIPFQVPSVAGAFPMVDPGARVIVWATSIPISSIPPIPASLLYQGEIQFNYRFQGGF